MPGGAERARLAVSSSATRVAWLSVARPVEDEGFGALGEALGNDLGVEGVGKFASPATRPFA